MPLNIFLINTHELTVVQSFPFHENAKTEIFSDFAHTAM